jgi:hypothetical protein
MAAHNSNATRPNTTCLPFTPGPEFKALYEKYNRVDRYLFRVTDKQSKAAINATWAKSNDAQRQTSNSHSDIFARKSYNDVAAALRRHLCLEALPHGEDNLVSWTSSLLSALQVGFEWAWQSGDHSRENTFISVVDTARLPARVFMSDMFLISAFSKYDTSARLPSASRMRLSDIHSLRQRKHPEYAGSNYFGEYLSQGALRVEGHLSMVSLAGIVNAGFYTLRQDLSLSKPKDKSGAVSIIKLREKFYTPSSRCPAEAFEIRSALRIGEKYGPSWKLPMALAFLALKPRQAWDDGIMEAFREFHGMSRLLESLGQHISDDM